jgi:hypothetical protein
MAFLPQADRAIVELRKIEDYCLNAAHSRGRHKARVFLRALGLQHQDAAWLREKLLEGVRVTEAMALDANQFGTRWRVDVSVAREARSMIVRTVWIVRTGEQAPVWSLAGCCEGEMEYAENVPLSVLDVVALLTEQAANGLGPVRWERSLNCSIIRPFSWSFLTMKAAHTPLCHADARNS